MYIYLLFKSVCLSRTDRLTGWLKSVCLSSTDWLTGWLSGWLADWSFISTLRDISWIHSPDIFVYSETKEVIYKSQSVWQGQTDRLTGWLVGYLTDPLYPYAVILVESILLIFLYLLLRNKSFKELYKTIKYISVYIYIYLLFKSVCLSRSDRLTGWLKSVCLSSTVRLTDWLADWLAGWLILYIHTPWYNLNPFSW